MIEMLFCISISLSIFTFWMEVPVQKPSTFKLKARLPIPLFGICDGKHIRIISYIFYVIKENQQK